jgi:hypothetical protein
MGSVSQRVSPHEGTTGVFISKRDVGAQTIYNLPAIFTSQSV